MCHLFLEFLRACLPVVQLFLVEKLVVMALLIFVREFYLIVYRFQLVWLQKVARSDRLF